MLKTKYEKMSKKEKKKIVEVYKQTEAGKKMMIRLLRLNIIGVLGILYAIFLFVYEFKTIEWSDYMIIVPLLVISIFFLFMSYRLRKKVLNQFAIKKEK